MDILELRKTLHDLPEKSFAEVKTRECLDNWLRENTDFTVIDCENWFYAVKKGGNRVFPCHGKSQGIFEKGTSEFSFPDEILDTAVGLFARLAMQEC